MCSQINLYVMYICFRKGALQINVQHYINPLWENIKKVLFCKQHWHDLKEKMRCNLKRGVYQITPGETLTRRKLAVPLIHQLHVDIIQSVPNTAIPYLQIDQEISGLWEWAWLYQFLTDFHKWDLHMAWGKSEYHNHWNKQYSCHFAKFPLIANVKCDYIFRSW